MRATTRIPRFLAAATHSPKKSRSLQEFSVAMELHLGWIEGENAGDADEDNVRFGGVPVVGPLFHVHHGGIVLGHVGLAHAANSLLPGLVRGVKWTQARRQRDELGRGPADSGVSNCFREER